MPGNQRLMFGLFVCLGAALALATSKLPVVAVSLSAPLFAWIALEACATRTASLAPRWGVLAAAFWLSLLGSLALNVIYGDLGLLGERELALLLRFGFWLTVFLTTAAITGRAEWTPRLCAALAATAVALGLLRLADAAVVGEPWLDQNEYGLRFSAFLPFLLAACLSRAGWMRALGLALSLAALAGNGSRSSWVAVGVAAAASLAFYTAAGRRGRGAIMTFAAAPVLLAAALLLAPQSFNRHARDRWESFSTLATDKPFQTRLALLEKGALLFEAQPVFGAGLGRFSLERVELASGDLPWTNNKVFNSRSSHNAYLSLLAETGITGALCFAVLLGSLVIGGARAAYRMMRAGNEWALGVWASTLAVSIHLWTLAGLTGTLPWFIFGLMAGVIEKENRRKFA